MYAKMLEIIRIRDIQIKALFFSCFGKMKRILHLQKGD